MTVMVPSIFGLIVGEIVSMEKPEGLTLSLGADITLENDSRICEPPDKLVTSDPIDGLADPIVVPTENVGASALMVISYIC